MRVKSKIDWWISIIIFITMAFLALAIFTSPKNEQLIGYLVGIPMFIFLCWIYFGTYYELTEEFLLCKCGPFFERIKYHNIKSIKLSENFLSSMALSRHRIEIKQHNKGYFTGTTFISPINREHFIKELKVRCKNLE